MEVFAIIALTAGVFCILWLANREPALIKFPKVVMTKETANQVALEKTLGFSTAHFDPPEKIESTLERMDAFLNSISDEECYNLRSAYKGWISYHRGNARRNLAYSRKQASVRQERRRLGL